MTAYEPNSLAEVGLFYFPLGEHAHVLGELGQSESNPIANDRELWLSTLEYNNEVEDPHRAYNVAIGIARLFEVVHSTRQIEFVVLPELTEHDLVVVNILSQLHVTRKLYDLVYAPSESLRLFTQGIAESNKPVYELALSARIDQSLGDPYGPNQVREKAERMLFSAYSQGTEQTQRTELAAVAKLFKRHEKQDWPVREAN